MRFLVSLFILLVILTIYNYFHLDKNTDKQVNNFAKIELAVINPLTRVAKKGKVSGSSSVHIYSARNEVEPFQFVISSGDKPIEVSHISLDSLRNENNEYIDQIAIFKQHYVPVLEPSAYSPYPPKSYPDALIPILSSTSNSPYSALPTSIKTNENLAIWVDITVPENQPAGNYQGKLIVTSSDQKKFILPVTLTVWNFTLPKLSPLRTLVGIDAERVVNIYNKNAGEQWNKTDWQHVRNYYDLLLDHHLSPGEFADASPFPSDDDKHLIDDVVIPGLGTIYENMQHYIFEKNASTYMYAFGQRYEDNPDNEGYPFNDMLGKNRTKAQHFLAQYANWCSNFLPLDRCQINYAAFHDEPEFAGEYEILRQWGNFVNEAEKQAKTNITLFASESPVANTKDSDDPNQEQPMGQLTGYVDGWNIPSSDLWMLLNGSSNILSKRLALNEPFYAHALPLAYLPRKIPKHYTDTNLKGIFLGRWLAGSFCNKTYPSFSKCSLQTGIPGGTRGIDYPPINYRITAWLIEPYGITGLEEWDSIYWNQDKNGDDIDVWKTAKNIADNSDEEHINGDGMLIYPGRQSSIGFDGPVASIRLKWLREAVEDFSYIKLLRGYKEDAFIQQQNSLFIRDLGDWDDSPELMMQAREAFGKKLHLLAEAQK